MIFSQPDRSRRRRSSRPRLAHAAERLESRALMTSNTGHEFSRPPGIPAATEPTAYFDVSTGELQLDPVGQNLTLFNFTYNTEVKNVDSTSPGPFVYSSGTLTNAVSTATEKKTFPAGGWTLLTTFPARLAGAVSLTNIPTLATSGATSASSNGWFNRPWNFGTVVAPKSLTVFDAERNFIAVNTPTDAGYGVGRGLFQYTKFQTVGQFYGRVIAYATPDPASKPNAILGVATDEIVVSRSSGGSLTTSTLAPLPADVTWVNTVAGDFNGDGRTDTAMQTSAGAWWVTQTPASGSSTTQVWGTVAASQFATVGDFNGDKRDDIAVRDPVDGSWRVLTSTGSGFTASRFGRWNPQVSWSNVLAGDFNKDGRDDLVGQRSDGQWIVATSTGTAFSSSLWAVLAIGQFGSVGDFNGDGRDDVAVRNPNNGSWRVLTSTGSSFSDQRFGSWDATTTWSNARPGDFNGDGRTDLVGQRADGSWWVSLSTGSAFTTSAWGALPVGQFVTVGDFNADGLDDVAVRNPANGIWRLLGSTGSSFTSARFGSWPTTKVWSRAFAARA